MITIHGSCVAIEGGGVLLRGASGAGKSDLALRLIDRGAVLVADDRVALRRGGEGPDREGPGGDGLMAAAPAAIGGLLEVRGVGIVRVPAIAEAPLRLVVDLVAPDVVERLPEPQWVTLMSVRVPLLALAPFECSAPVKIALALRAVREGTLGSAPELLAGAGAAGNE